MSGNAPGGRPTYGLPFRTPAILPFRGHSHTASNVMGPLRCPAAGIELLYLVEESKEELVIGHEGAAPRSLTGAHVDVHP